MKKISDLQAELAKLAQEAKQEPPKLIAVSKTRTAVEIEVLIQQGQREFGENRVQEAQEKWPDLLQKYPDLRLRLIGPLQTNKLKFLPNLFHAVDSLDRVSLADGLARLADKTGYAPECLIQVNTGEEEQKAGIAPKDLEQFLGYCQGLHLKVTGLMCIPPMDQVASIHFAFLKKLTLDHDLVECSMGMSGDYDLAAQFGSTMVRVGTKLFGARD